MVHHLTATGRHLPYGITQCYQLSFHPTQVNAPHPSHAGWYSIYLPRRDGRLSWPTSGPAGRRTSDLSIMSLTPNRCTIKTSPTPYGIPKIAGSQPQLKTAITIISGTGKATNFLVFKFGRYIHSVHPNLSPLKILEKRECGVGVSRDFPFFEYPVLSQEWVKLRTSNLAGTFTRSIQMWWTALLQISIP